MVLNDIATEMKHTFMLKFGVTNRRLFFDYLLLPAVVAMTIVLAFLARHFPGDHRMGLIFFSTLYAFWCGLFGTCQVFNGEVASGEWSFWMLGMHRSLFLRLLAQVLTSMLAVSIQVGFCILFFIPLAFVMKLTGEGVSFIDAFNSAYFKDGVYGLAAYKNMMAAGDTSMFFRFVFLYYIAGMFSASIAGIGLGLAISASFRETQSALIFSVCIIVLSSILSHMTLQGYEISESRIRDFSPIYIDVAVAPSHIQKPSDSPPRWRDAGVLEFLSRFLPQRYFYNIARLPILKLNGTTLNQAELIDHSKTFPANCKCLICTGIIKLTTKADVTKVEDEFSSDIPFAKHWISMIDSTSPGKWNTLLEEAKIPAIQNIWDGQSLTEQTRYRQDNQRTLDWMRKNNFAHINGLFRCHTRMLAGEFCVLVCMFSGCCLFSYIRLKTGVMFNELR